MKKYAILLCISLLLVGCSSKKDAESNQTEFTNSEELDTNASVEQEDFEFCINTGKTMEEYVDEMGVTQEDSKIVMCYQYENYTQYKVYEFEETAYRLTYYDFYKDKESFVTPYQFMEKYGSNYINEWFDLSCYLHCYQDTLKRGEKQEAYAGVMYSIETQIENSENNSIFIVKEK